MSEIANALIAAAPGFRTHARGRHVEIPKNALFSTLSRQQLRLILPHIKFKKYRPGRVLLGEGARNPGKIYIVLDGQIALSKQGVSPMESRPENYELGVLRRGDIFGEVSFVDGQPSPVSFEAKTDVSLAVADLSASHRKTVRRLREIVTGKLRRYVAQHARESAALRMSSMQLENQLAAYRGGVGQLVITTLFLFSIYTLALSFLPAFKNQAHANFVLSPLIILLCALIFFPAIATSGFSGRFFGLQLDNWRAALGLSVRASFLFILAFVAVKWVLINTSPSFAGVSIIGGADIEVDGKMASHNTWYWVALAVYLLLTPMQEFVARSGVQAPLYAFLHGSESKRRWLSILASNLVFSAGHAHISVPFAMAAFLPGILWGWLFAKTNSLLAATVSHIIVGGTGLFLFGIEGVVSRLAS
jgi:membrane protease YdiL (CAAX protease family)/CRP-like cAMP-binding protein